MPRVVVEIILILLIFLIIYRIIKLSKALKYNDRINKYTITKLKNNNVSLGDKLENIYNRIKKTIVKSLNNSTYFKRKADKYERFSFIGNPFNIIATKISIAMFTGLCYLITSVFKNNFNVMFLLLFIVLGYFIYNIYLLISEKIRNKNIENDLLKAIMIMNNAFKSGYNITQGIGVVSKDLNGPISEEFTKISNDLKYGLELQDAFGRFANRVNVDGARYISSSLSLLNITGGNLIGIFESIEKSFINRKRLQDELKSMTSSSRLVFYILMGMPILIISVLLLINPTYYSPLFKYPIGILICFLILILYIGYILIIRKVLRIDT